MTIKRILVPLPDSAKYDAEVDTALSAARALEAFVEPPPPPTTRARSMDMGYGRVAVTAEQVNWAAEERERRAQDAREAFARECALKGVRLLAPGEEPGQLPAASWRHIEGASVGATVARAAAFDLVVAASAAVMDTLAEVAEQSLLQPRRPVLLSSSRPTNGWGGTAMIAWDESPECWHAVSAALPFLRLARSVQVVSVDRHADRRTPSQAEAVAYLRCHGIAATPRVIAPHLRSVADTLLATAGEEDVGLLVMGAYSHSRLREMLIGGVTRHILKNAAARPVLLAH